MNGGGDGRVPTGLDPSWLGETQTGIRTDGVSVDQQLSVAELDATDGVITGCAVAIAETGTLILDARLIRARRVITLIPDYHLCVVLPDQIVADVPQAPPADAQPPLDHDQRSERPATSSSTGSRACTVPAP